MPLFFMVLFTSWILPSHPCYGQYWTELPSAYGYRQTDFYIEDYQGYHVVEVGARVGLHAVRFSSVATLQPYVAGFAIRDMGQNVWNEVDWHNNVVYGLGLQLRVHPGTLFSLQPREFNLEFFGEQFWIQYFPTDAFYTGVRPTNDLRVGMRFWTALGGLSQAHGMSRHFWLDVAGGMAYSKSSFFVRSQNNFYLISLHTRLGPSVWLQEKWALQPMLSYQLQVDLGPNAWNNLDWYNRQRFGGGLRLRYARFPLLPVRQVERRIHALC